MTKEELANLKQQIIQEVLEGLEISGKVTRNWQGEVSYLEITLLHNFIKISEDLVDLT